MAKRQKLPEQRLTLTAVRGLNMLVFVGELATLEQLVRDIRSVARDVAPTVGPVSRKPTGEDVIQEHSVRGVSISNDATSPEGSGK